MIIKTEKDFIQNYLTDASNFKSSGCEAIYIPESYDELVELIKYANESKIQVTISGAGTGLVGGRVPNGGVVISLEKFDKILSFDINSKNIRVQTFVSLNVLQNYLREFRLFYPPDPTEKNCSIGGTVATNASGARTLKYGPTRNWINAIKVVFPDGDILDLKRGEIFADGVKFRFETKSSKIYSVQLPNLKIPEVKNAAGYFIQPNMDLIDLFIGSEGTLGIILEAELKLLNEPDEIISMVVFFDTFEDAFEFVSNSRLKEKDKRFEMISPRALEFFDDRALNFLSSKFPKVKSKRFAIWFEQEIYNHTSNTSKDHSYKEKLLDQIFKLISICKGNLNEIWFAFNEKEINDIKEFRHSISAMVNEYISKNDLRKVGTDIAVPSEYFRNFYHYCCDECVKNSIDYVGYGHIGNNHLHFNMLPSNKEQNELAIKLYRDFCEKAIEFGGTISAEHGIGKLKRQYFELMYPENVLKEMFEIKKVFDPNLIINRGNIFSEKFYQ